MNTLGPLISQSIARNIGGNAARSELDRLSEPLKRLVSRHSLSRDWLLSALDDSSFPSTKVSMEEKSLFVKKVIRYSMRFTYISRFRWCADEGYQSKRVSSYKSSSSRLLDHFEGHELFLCVMRCCYLSLAQFTIHNSQRLPRQLRICIQAMGRDQILSSTL